MSALSEKFRDGLLAAWARSDALFALVPQAAWRAQPIDLRHPILFYVGHLPAFAWNQIGRGALDQPPIDPRLDALYARGIDPENVACAQQHSPICWPTVGETQAYRDTVRAAVLRCLPQVFLRTDDILCEHGRVLQLVLEHEWMHHETLLYMLAESPPGLLQRPAAIAPPEAGDGQAAEPRRVEAGPAVLGASFAQLPFGWDNEFPQVTEWVPAFSIDSLPVRNRDWLAFFEARGRPDALWPQGWARDPQGKPQGKPTIKTLFGPLPFAAGAGFPVQVSGEQARAYCAWRGGRLATEAELHRAAYHTPDGSLRPHPWGDAPPGAEHGNFGFRHFHPTPVGQFPAGDSAWGVGELVGNGWEWTQSPFAPRPGFVAWARTYPGYSADFFDGEHDIVFGASWATADGLLRRSFRNWYRRSYPFPFTSFRVVS